MPAARPASRNRLPRALRTGMAVSLLLHLGVAASLSSTRLFEPASLQTPVTVVARWGPAATSSRPEARTGSVLTEVSQVTAGLVQTRLNDALRQQQNAKPDEQLQRIERMGQQLRQLSTPDSLDEISQKFSSWMGYSTRASQPAVKPPSGEFDFDTAQIHDVIRRERFGGGYRYFAMMLDSQGRTSEAELDAASGETMYQLMQRIHNNPLLSQVYRQIFMPLADQLTHKAALGAGPSSPPPPAN
jgi:hypothetical protein